MDTQYWLTRQSQRTGPLVQAIKRNGFARRTLGTVFSVRMGDELFLSRAFRRFNIASVLEIACGAGKVVIGSLPFSAGVDIRGSPIEHALRKGYREVHWYEPPEYRFSIDRQVDAVACINLNAHVSPDVFYALIGRAVECLRVGGKLILVCELDNDGLSYRWMRQKNLGAWRRVVKAMDHDFLEKEQTFLNRMKREGKYRLLYRQPIIAGALPALHFRWFFQMLDPKVGSHEITAPVPPLIRAGLLAADVPLGLWNSLQCASGERVGHAFVVGYVFDVS